MFRSLTIAVTVSLVTLLLVYGMVTEGRARRTRTLLDELPSTAHAVVRIDVRALRRSAAMRALVEAMLADDRLSEIETACGLNPIADLREVRIWVRGSETQPLQSLGLMLEGDGVDGEALARCHKQLVEARGGSVVRVEATTGPVLSSRDGMSAIALLDESTVVTGSARTVAETVAASRNLRPALAHRPSMARLWSEVATNASVAAVAELPDHWKKGIGRAVSPDALASALEDVEAIGVSLGLRDERRARLILDVESEALAARSAERIRAWAEAPPSSVRPPWDAVLRSAQVVVAGRSLRIDLDISQLLHGG
jgi:hypothetical protein